MGMYDYVDTGPYGDVACPECGAPLSGWQSKDGPCALLVRAWFTVSRFYTSCDSCGLWVEFERDYPRNQKPFDGYTMKTERRRPHPKIDG